MSHLKASECQLRVVIQSRNELRVVSENPAILKAKISNSYVFFFYGFSIWNVDKMVHYIESTIPQTDSFITSLQAV